MPAHQPKTSKPSIQSPVAFRSKPGFSADIGGNSKLSSLAQLKSQVAVSPKLERSAALQRAADARLAPVQRVEEEDLLQGKMVQRVEEEDELQGKMIQRVEEEEELLQGKAVQRIEDEDLLQGKMIQRAEDEELLQGKIFQRAVEAAARTNNTGLPDNLKAGIESLSGMSLDGVKVHRNSDKPAQVQAHAYAQGTDIHLAPGQEQHLPHEAWHVVQQAQGRVKPTMQMKGVAVNDDAGLETEADVMGAKATQFKSDPSAVQRARDSLAEGKTVQLGKRKFKGKPLDLTPTTPTLGTFLSWKPYKNGGNMIFYTLNGDPGYSQFHVHTDGAGNIAWLRKKEDGGGVDGVNVAGAPWAAMGQRVMNEHPDVM